MIHGKGLQAPCAQAPRPACGWGRPQNTPPLVLSPWVGKEGSALPEPGAAAATSITVWPVVCVAGTTALACVPTGRMRGGIKSCGHSSRPGSWSSVDRWSFGTPKLGGPGRNLRPRLGTGASEGKRLSGTFTVERISDLLYRGVAVPVLPPWVLITLLPGGTSTDLGRVEARI